VIGNDTITIVTRTVTGRGSLGVATYSETETAVAGCSFQAGQPTEDTGLGTTVVSATAKVFMPVTPVTTGLSANDTIKYNGQTWQVRGPVITPTDLEGNPDHVWCIAQWTVS